MSQLHIEIIYSMTTGVAPSIRTNVKQERVADLLADWVHMTQIGAGKDESKAHERDEYKIHIALELEDDSFRSKSDTGNKGLTCGIVMDTLNTIKAGKVTWLE